MCGDWTTQSEDVDNYVSWANNTQDADTSGTFFVLMSAKQFMLTLNKDCYDIQKEANLVDASVELLYSFILRGLKKVEDTVSCPSTKSTFGKSTQSTDGIRLTLADYHSH
ncbi:hypothetical protein Tco_0861318 [Tanacetum coccineum]|uniref:Uncharacterized protein n=1 Tax=Tanacetum coccineum TaxID=301880 RepID=A0ABQ5BHX2_9ASTR